MGRGQQALVIPLGADIYQLFADQGQVRAGHDPTLDGNGRTAIGLDSPAQHQRPFVKFEVPLGKQIGKRGGNGSSQIETGTYRGTVTSASDRLHIRLLPQQEGERTEDDRFSGTGFPGNDRKAFTEIDSYILYQGIMVNLKPLKHESLLQTS